MTIYKGNKVIAGSRSYIGNIGDIKFTSRIDLPYGGAWCDGSIKLKAQYPAVYQMLVDGKLQYVDIATYENVLRLNGSCGFFGFDAATESFRVPTLTDVYLKAGQEADEFSAESLPNISGSLSSHLYADTELVSDGSFEITVGTNNRPQAGTAQPLKGVTFDASLSSSTYQDGAKVNPDHVKYRAYVVLYNGDDIKSDITKEYQLNNPFFFGMSQYFEVDPKNASWLKSDGAFHNGAVYESFYNWLLSIFNGETVEGVSVKSSADTYGDYDYVVNTTEETFRLPIRTKDDYVVEEYINGTEWYRVYKSGWVEQGGISAGTQTSNTVSVKLIKPYKDKNYSVQLTTQPTDHTNAVNRIITLSGTISNTQFNITNNGWSESYNGCVAYWQASGQGADNPTSRTYFYVGEAVQDANLLNAGKVLDLLAKLESYDYVVESKVATDDDPTWYRVYKSGWVEQGGSNFGQSLPNRVEVSFPKPFANINYTITLGELQDYQGTGSWPVGISDKSVLGFTHQGAGNGSTRQNSFHWHACGQGA